MNDDIRIRKGFRISVTSYVGIPELHRLIFALVATHRFYEKMSEPDLYNLVEVVKIEFGDKPELPDMSLPSAIWFTIILNAGEKLEALAHYDESDGLTRLSLGALEWLQTHKGWSAHLDLPQISGLNSTATYEAGLKAGEGLPGAVRETLYAHARDSKERGSRLGRLFSRLPAITGEIEAHKR